VRASRLPRRALDAASELLVCSIVKTTNRLRNTLFATALLAAPASLVLLSSCAGYMTVDGYDGTYVDAPANVETYPQYRFADGYAYEVNGVYYHQHEGRWVRYRSAPQGMVRVNAQVRGDVHVESHGEAHGEEHR
jgi:hypothetical protein